MEAVSDIIKRSHDLAASTKKPTKSREVFMQAIMESKDYYDENLSDNNNQISDELETELKIHVANLAELYIQYAKMETKFRQGRHVDRSIEPTRIRDLTTVTLALCLKEPRAEEASPRGGEPHTHVCWLRSTQETCP